MAKLKYCQLSAQAENILRQHAAHGQNLSVLKQQQLWQDAVFYTIFMLPYEQALELVLLFIPANNGQELPQEQKLLLQQARQWRANANNNDALRHELFAQAQQIGFDNPISCLVLSIFFSEGSMTPPNVEAVESPPWLAPTMLANALCLILHFYTADPELQNKQVALFFQHAEIKLKQLLPDQDKGRKMYLCSEHIAGGE